MEKRRLTENSQHGFRKGRSPWLTSRGEFFADVTAGLGKGLRGAVAGAGHFSTQCNKLRSGNQWVKHGVYGTGGDSADSD